jgi:site-specific recombinase XerC
MQQKTQRPVQFEITEPTRKSVFAWIRHAALKTEDYLFPSRKNLRAVQLLLGHTKLESTVRYLGIEVDDALEMAEQTEV